MLNRRLGPVAFLSLFAFLNVGTTHAWPHRRGEKALVRFVAESTFIRGTWGTNEDIYLVEINMGKADEMEFARLVDKYPNEWSPISRNVLELKTGTLLRIERDSSCDVEYSQILLRAAPGDLMAILPETMSYRQKLDVRLTLDHLLPCYRTLRK